MSPRVSASRFLLACALVLGRAHAQDALYYAGTAGNPPVAPSPQSQGWSLADGGGGVGLKPISPDGTTGLNAWEIADSVAATNGWAYYGDTFPDLELPYLAGTWELTMTMRMTAGPSATVAFGIDSGSTIGDSHYEVRFEIVGPDVIARPLSTGTPYVCVGGAGSYHTFTIRKTQPGTYVPAEFLFDGIVLGSVDEQIYTNWGPAVFFGARGDLELGRTRVNRVELRRLDDLGTNYCSPAVDNSTGAPGVIDAEGSPYVNQGLLTLTASQLPAGKLGYFLASRTQGLSQPPGSQGFLCLAGDIGRFNAPLELIQGPVGQLAVDLTDIPVHPPVAVQPGETWNFQCWYRDAGGTSNFTDAVEIEFR